MYENTTTKLALSNLSDTEGASKRINMKAAAFFQTHS